MLVPFRVSRKGRWLVAPVERPPGQMLIEGSRARWRPGPWRAPRATDAERMSRSPVRRSIAKNARMTAGLDLAIEHGWLAMHESGKFVWFTQAGADLFA